jgi:hypothetical protein
MLPGTAVKGETLQVEFQVPRQTFRLCRALHHDNANGDVFFRARDTTRSKGDQWGNTALLSRLAGLGPESIAFRCGD